MLSITVFYDKNFFIEVHEESRFPNTLKTAFMTFMIASGGILKLLNQSRLDFEIPSTACLALSMIG